MSDDKTPARFAATRHGVPWRYRPLPREDGDQFGTVLEALREGHTPQGPTGKHPVEEVAGIIWRRRRPVAPVSP